MITNDFRNARTDPSAGNSARATFMFTLSLTLLIVAAGETVPASDPAPSAESTANPEDRHVASAKDDGYRGIWFTLGQKSEFGDKYSGGLGTYTANHVPIAIHAPQVQKTFFVYGGAKEGRRYLLAMASYYDHQQQRVPRPTIVHDKQGVDDPHDDPSLALDEHGHLWVFVSGRGQRRPGFVYRSVEPYSTDAFERILEDEFTYPQPWWIEGQGFLHLFTRYTRGRELYFALSQDGRTWSEPTKLAGMGGHYQVSNAFGKRIITGFMMHPGGNVDRRTNLYYAETRDMGRTWQTVDGQPLQLPLADPLGPALVRNYQAEGRLVYVNDTQLDAEGNPVILYVTSANYQPGPGGEPRYQTIARWDGRQWLFHEIARTTHNYDMGSLYIEADGVWRAIVPSEPGPQRWGTGGEVAIWTSRDQGATWNKAKDVTAGSQRNHSYMRRPVNARDDFYAFWADGDADQFSRSYLYFTDKEGKQVKRLPYDMDGEFAQPELVER
ncbi:MAG: glycoside hydrolase [Pirellulaceae bacterium]|nr:glycoside hydrolase [Pirellulaceae bacterium]